MTHRADFLFAVKEHGPDDPPWIYLEPRGGAFPGWENRFLGLYLRPGTTMQEAQEIARVLNENVDRVGLTMLPKR